MENHVLCLVLMWIIGAIPTVFISVFLEFSLSYSKTVNVICSLVWPLTWLIGGLLFFSDFIAQCIDDISEAKRIRKTNRKELKNKLGI